MKVDTLEFVADDSQRSATRRKLVIIETAGAMAGVQQTTLHLVEHLDRARWEPVVVCPEEGELTDAIGRAGVAVRILPRPHLCSTSFWIGNRTKLPNPLAWLWDAIAILVASRRVATLLDRERPDLVLTKGLLCHLYGGLAAQKRGVPCIWHVEDFISERFAGIYRRAFAQLAGWLPTSISVIGSPIRRQLHGGALEKVNVVPNGINTCVFRPSLTGSGVRREFNIEPGELVIGNVSRLTPWKGQDLLLDAFARLPSEVPARLLLAGAPLFESEAYEHRLRAKARELGVGDRVIFAGHRKDIPQVLAAMDIFAYTAVEKDVWPLSLLQAMAAGLPVVAFDIEGVREPIGGDENALLVPVLCVEPFARALGELAANQGLRRRLGEASRRRAEEAFSVERYVSQMEATFYKTLGQLSPPMIVAQKY